VTVVVEIKTRDGEGRQVELDDDKFEITIGRVPQNDIALPRGNVSARHSRVVVKDGKLILVDLKSVNGTYVNGRKVTSPLVISKDDKIYIGDFTLQFRFFDTLEDEDTHEVDVTELRLLSGVAQQEEGSRLVYADWLEGQGDVTRAEFLRIQEAIPELTDAAELTVLSERMRELAATIEIEWRRKVARPLVENCSLGFELECPKNWGSLSVTDKSRVRFCGACEKHVFYCSTIGEARTHAEMGNCVAVDVVAIRRPHDLDVVRKRPMRMGMIMPVGDE